MSNCSVITPDSIFRNDVRLIKVEIYMQKSYEYYKISNKR